MYHFNYFPRYVALERYQVAIEQMLEILTSKVGIVAVFQIGHTKAPGISDLDILVVFDSGAKYLEDPRQQLDPEFHYLLDHNLFAVFQEDFQKAQSFTCFHNYNLLWGNNLDIQVNATESQQILQKQIALEYLLQMYINTSIRMRYKIFSIINLLRHINAVQYDLEFLGISQGKLFSLVAEMLQWRGEWFTSPIPTRKTLSFWVDAFYQELAIFLQDNLPLYLPYDANLQISKNITIVPGDNLHVRHGGFSLPPVFAGLGRKYFNIQHRFNHFLFEVPIEYEMPEFLQQRFAFLKTLRQKNQQHLPQFLPMASSLNVL